MITDAVPISLRIVINCEMKRDIPFEVEEKSIKTETTIQSEFANGGNKANVEKITSD